MTRAAASCRWLLPGLLLLLLAGCRQGGHPLAPVSGAGSDRLPVTLSPVTTAAETVLPLARYELTLFADGQDPILHLIPDRTTAAFGQRYFLDLTRGIHSNPALFLTPLGITRRGNNLTLQLQVRHPIPAGDPALAFSATNRLDLHLFGVMVVALSDSAGIDPTNGAVEGIRVDPTLLVNPHGYTSALPASVTGTQTSQHPYRVFFREDPLTQPENLGTGNFSDSTGFADVASPVGYNVLPQGATAQTDLVLPLPTVGSRTITLLIAGHFMESMPTTTGDPAPLAGSVVYFAPAAAGTPPAAVLPKITATGLVPRQSSGGIEVQLDILDWQHGRPADAAYPNPANPGGLPQASGVKQVRIFAPAFSDTPIDLTTADNAPTATGLINAPLRFTATIPNNKGPIGGTYYAIAIVEDEAAAGGETDADRLKTIRARSQSGTVYVPPSNSTLQILPVVVPAGVLPPVVQLEPIGNITVGQALEFTVRACDPDGAVQQLEWDFDFTGTFTTDLTTNFPATGGSTTLEIRPPNACVPTNGPVTIAVRGVDNDGLRSVVSCDDPPGGSSASFADCVITGGPFRSCRSFEIQPRSGPLLFAAEVNVSGPASQQTPFADSRSSGQHGLVVSPNGRELWIVYHVVRSGFETGNVFLARSTDSGSTFTTPLNVTQITPEQPPRPGDPPPAGPVANHPSIALYEAEGKLHPVIVYARGLFLEQNIVFRSSADQGVSFSNEVTLTRDGNQGQPGIVMGPDNQVYVCFTDWDAPGGDEILVARSQLGTSGLQIERVNDIRSDAGATVRWRTDYLVSQTAPALVVDPVQDRLVVTWSDAAAVGNDRARIMADRTPLSTLSFGPDVAVSPAPAAGEYHFEPSPVLRPQDRGISIAWRRSRLEASQLAVDLFVSAASSALLTGGFTAPVQVSDATGLPRIAFAPSLGADAGGNLYLAWQGAPTGNTGNYDIFLDQSPNNGATWGTDQSDIDTEPVVQGQLRTEQALNPMLATIGCITFIGWAGPSSSTDQNNLWSIFLDAGT